MKKKEQPLFHLLAPCVTCVMHHLVVHDATAHVNLCETCSSYCKIRTYTLLLILLYGNFACRSGAIGLD